MFDLHRLRLLKELHTRGTLAAVAAALGYSSSAVSQQLSLLEKEAGAPLLERVGRGVRLTPQAVILAGHAEAVLNRLEQAEAEIEASLTAPTGVVRVASFQTAMLSLMPPLLDLVALRAPNLRLDAVQLEPDQALSLLTAGGCDLVLAEEYFGHPLTRRSGIDQVELGLDAMRLALPPRLADRTELAQLAGERWILEPADTESGRWARTLCREAGFEPDVAFHSTDIVTHIRFVETGHAVGILPDLVWQDVPPRGVELGHRRLFTCARTGAQRRPGVVTVREALRDVYASRLAA
ncbi:LysR family transcriptional regulator [Kutzneria buriramensis]|uniref:DNA-binding transcriptional LysR family regulator n=1 Tax=Kutzneria buriramensis TaxID=1045776 RepID=A0A3E0HP28_9PSEU|nr:LysR family transcriptional regulator [Kutzneria buriramensis]REH48204.1 DNA-binding transcriptional LysR family regulator [Kutzneria buriramensis]